MSDSLVVNETRVFTWLKLAFYFGAAMMFGAGAVANGDPIVRIAGALLFLLFAFGVWTSLNGVRRHRRIATFLPTGVIDEFGREFLWHQLDGAWMVLGALNLKALQEIGQTVHLDPAQVGGKAVKAARAYLKQYAPPELTEKI